MRHTPRFRILREMALTAAAAASLACVPLVQADAQRLSLIGGLTFSQLRGLDEVKSENRNGAMFGVSLNVPVGPTWALQPEALFLSKGGRFGPASGAAGATDIRLDYLEIPVLLRRNFGGSSVFVPHLYGGPSVSFNVNCSIDITRSGVPEASSDCERENFEPKSLEYGAVVGGGIDISLAGFAVTAGARYGVGLTHVTEENAAGLRDRARNGTLAVYAGFRIFGR
ncbi:MAG: porin family protein [Gemmatimonadota bacterium]